MAPISPARAARVQQLAQALAGAPQGAKGALTAATAGELGVSPQTINKWVKSVSIRNPRKRRADAGESSLPRPEAAIISAALMESQRKNGKQLLAIDKTLDMLRANGLVRAERTDPVTNEVKLLSASAVGRALRAYGLHPETLLRPAPAMSLASRHPNHIWQIDASVCVLYYLPRQDGLQVMRADEFYKNKPDNMARVERDRVWRYAITDHASGHVYVEYVLGAESGENLVGVFVNAISRREGQPVHGVPLAAMLDPGSANTGALFRNLCKALQVRVLINQVGNPRAKGQVEKAHDLIEKSFESRLKFCRIETLEQLNAEAAQWMRSFNGASVMRRHGMTRYEAWMRITADQLRLAPEPAVCRELATSEPLERTVTDKLQVSYLGGSFDVSIVPDVQNGSKLLVCRNPWRKEAAQVVAIDADGREVFYVVEPVAKDDFGFDRAAPVIGETYARHADTPAQRAAKDIEMMLMGETTLDGAGAARKDKRQAFAGRIDPFLDIAVSAESLPAYIPKRGTALETPLPGIVAAPSVLTVPQAMAVEAERLNHVQMAMALAVYPWWDADAYGRVVRLYPDGVLEVDLPAVAERLQQTPKLVAVG